MCRFAHIRGIADEFAEEDLLVPVEGVDDEAQKLVDLRLEREDLWFHHRNVSHRFRERERETIVVKLK